MLAILLLVLGIASRFIFHVPNFTPVIALALFGGVYLKRRQAILLPLALFAITDLFLGFHSVMAFTWGSVVLIALAGLWLRDHKKVSTTVTTSLASSVGFFLITNLGVWMVGGLYPLSFAGLVECFTLAIPFFRSTLLSTLAYTVVLFGVYELIAMKAKNTRFAKAL